MNGHPDMNGQEAIPLYGTPPATVEPVVAALDVCTRCQGTIAPDGYCLECGAPRMSARDHFRESPTEWVGGVCDRGLVHGRNEDALAICAVAPPTSHPEVGAVPQAGALHLGPPGTGVIVVCDGVSTSPDSDAASLAAARSAVQAAERVLAQATVESNRSGVLRGALLAGAQAARAAVAALGGEGEEAPSCTYVACAVEPGIVVAAWLGDSRVYWIPDGDAPVRLTTDHSWASELVARGVEVAEAERAPGAHAITRWVGADAPVDDVPSVQLAPTGPGWVLVCSDGLWNYCSPAQELAALLRELTRAGDAERAPERAAAVSPDVGGGVGLGCRTAADLAGDLVTWANAQGGRDNVTVALARIDAVVPMSEVPTTLAEDRREEVR